jgi:citrate lyase subunit beta/citryl-CoA lyase
VNVPAAARSYLYVPADRPERLEGALGRGADALIVDLEDGVAVPDKERARAAAAAWLGRQDPGGTELWVRINAETLEEDIRAITGPSLLGVVVPKAEPESLALVDTLLTQAEQRLGLPQGTLRVLPLIESARGLLLALGVARSPRVVRLGLGEADLAADLGMIPGLDRAEMAPLRLQVVVASAAAGIGRPVGPTSTDFRDLDAFRRSAQALLRLGFRSRTAVHPSQLPVIHEVFTPGEDEVLAAQDLLARFDAAGGGVVMDATGKMVDLAVVRSAREILGRSPQN